MATYTGNLYFICFDGSDDKGPYGEKFALDIKCLVTDERENETDPYLRVIDFIGGDIAELRKKFGTDHSLADDGHYYEINEMGFEFDEPVNGSKERYPLNADEWGDFVAGYGDPDDEYYTDSVVYDNDELFG